MGVVNIGSGYTLDPADLTGFMGSVYSHADIMLDGNIAAITSAGVCNICNEAGTVLFSFTPNVGPGSPRVSCNKFTGNLYFYAQNNGFLYEYTPAGVYVGQITISNGGLYTFAYSLNNVFIVVKYNTVFYARRYSPTLTQLSNIAASNMEPPAKPLQALNFDTSVIFIPASDVGYTQYFDDNDTLHIIDNTFSAIVNRSLI